MTLHRTTSTSHWFFYHKGRRVTTPHRDKSAAKEWAVQYSTGSVIGPENSKVDDLLDLVEQDYVSTGKRSIDALRSRLPRLRRAFGKIRAAELSEAQIVKYRDKRKAAPATVNRELEILRRALTLGQRKRLVANPAYVPMLRVDNVRTQRITHEQYKRLVDALPEPANWAAVLAYHTGWRRSRVLGLRWDQVDLKRNVIYPPSGQAGNKRVGIAPIYGDMQITLCLCRMEWPCADKVLHGVKDFTADWKRACVEIGVPGFRFHDLRACAASNLIDAGVPQIEAMRILGHKTTTMFARYQIDSAERVGQIGEKMGEYFGRTA